MLDLSGKPNKTKDAAARALDKLLLDTRPDVHLATHVVEFVEVFFCVPHIWHPTSICLLVTYQCVYIKNRARGPDACT
jgi:hypothetical protein